MGPLLLKPPVILVGEFLGAEMVDTNFNVEVNGTEITVETIPLHNCQIHSKKEISCLIHLEKGK